MKNLFLVLLLAIVGAGSSCAQKSQPVGMRMEVAESESDNGDYSIFTYKDEDETFGYYLALSQTSNFLGGDEVLGMQVKNISEIAIWLGATSDEALATVDDILAMFDKDLGTTEVWRGRAVTGSGRLSDAIDAGCVVGKKLLGGKCLQFFFNSGKRETYAILTKSVLKELRANFKFDLKLHPNQHRKK